MTKKKTIFENQWFGISAAFIAVILFIGYFIPMNMYMDMGMMDMDDHRENFIDQKNFIQGKMRMQQQYRCCLESPCTYCIEKDPKHGARAACDCLADIMNGIHPCGECIGEILEGHGNPYLSKYFAIAIAEETGHIETIREIIFEKYGTPAEEQL